MPRLVDAAPRCSVWLFKTIDRAKEKGSEVVSTRYKGNVGYIDLTGFLGDGASVRTSKSVREPAGGFSVTFTDSPQKDWSPTSASGLSLDSLSGLLEPMDVIEIRMWRGVGPSPGLWYPIVMRGFVSEISRGQAVDGAGRPMRTVTVAGQDWGKIWQTYQVLHMAAYAAGQPILTNFALAELFGIEVVNAMPAGDFVRTMIDRIINPHIQGFVPENLEASLGNSPLIQTGDGISVKHGKVNTSFHNAQGSVYDIMNFHGDVGHWNELYTEDREDGIHCVYRPIPALHLTQGPTNGSRKIMEDAPDPIYCPIDASEVESLSTSRGDAGVVNFFWVNNSRFDLIDDISRRLYGVASNPDSVTLSVYPNSSPKFYGVRAMNAESQQGEDEITNMTGGLPQEAQDRRSNQQVAWLDLRRQQLMDMNRDNVVLERGAARVKGCPMRPDGSGEVMKAGDYARFTFGSLTWDAYVYQVDHEFVPYQGYTTTLLFDRGEGFQRRMETEGSPWLLEQTSRRAIP